MVCQDLSVASDRCPSVLKKQRGHNGAGLFTLACFLVISAALSPTSRERSPCACMKLILQFAMAWAGRFLCQEGGEGRMTPGIKRLNHEAWLSLLALSVPLHDGKSVLNAFRHHRSGTGPASGEAPILCSTPFGITEDMYAADSPATPRVLNAFRHHRGGMAGPALGTGAGTVCSTPFGITTWARAAVVTPRISRWCSTPFGITEA